MTSPEEPTAADAPPQGEVERVPLKVVPIFVQPIEDEPELVEEQDEDADTVPSAEAAPRRRTRVVGIAAALLALGTIGVHIAAVVVSSAGDFATGAQLGWAVALLAAATIGVHIAAIVVASSGDFATGTVLSYVAIGLSALAVVAGISGAIVGPRRAWGIVAALVAVLANPVVLLWLLRQLSELQT